MLRVKNKIFLLVLISFLASDLLSGLEFINLTEQDILQSKQELEKAISRDRALKYAVIGAIAGGIGFTFFKALPIANDYLQFKESRDQVVSKKRLFSNISARNQDIMYRNLMKELIEERHKNGQLAFSSQLKGILNGLPTVAGMIVVPEIMRAIYQKVIYLFDDKNVLNLAKQLEIPFYFVRLEKSLVQFMPNEILKNNTYANRRDLINYSQQLMILLDSMPSEEKQAHYSAAKLMIIENSNILIKKMSFIIAQMRHIEQHEGQIKVLLDNFANQLFLITCEFSTQAQVSLDAQDHAGLLGAAISFQESFNLLLNNFVIFTR